MSTIKQSIRPTFRAQSKPFYFLLGTTLFTVMLGLAMVASASSIDSFKETASAWSTVFRQGGFAIIGIALLAIVSTLPVKLIRKTSLLALHITLGLQVLTVFFGIEINGNRNWLDIGFTSIQPSEFLKLGLILAFSHQLSKLTDDPYRNRQVWLWIAGYSGLALILVPPKRSALAPSSLKIQPPFFASIFDCFRTPILAPKMVPKIIQNH